jgi:hypothetical protein
MVDDDEVSVPLICVYVCGTRGGRVVLTVRQRQSRSFVAYDGFNFSGVLSLFDMPRQVYGAIWDFRECMIRHGVSSEFHPRALVLAADQVRLDGVYQFYCHLKQ